jgi:hypothetical protein
MIVAKYCIKNQASLHSLVGHCYEVSQKETIDSLRIFTETELKELKSKNNKEKKKKDGEIK